MTGYFRDLFSAEISPFWLKHMYSVLSAFTWRRLPPAACSRLCSMDSAWVGVFARSAMSSALSTSVILVSTRYRLFLAFFSGKLFSFIRSIEVRSTLSRQIMNRYGAKVSIYRTPTKISKKCVSPSGERTFTIVFLWSIIMGATVSLGRPSVWSKMPLKNLQI